MALFKCKMCGGTLQLNNNETVATCDYCGTQQTLPRINDERLTSFYERANDLRMSHEFDKAAEIYEKIIEENPTDADAYWSMVLCRYGIDYVEEVKGGARKPTINRAQLESVVEDINYRSALKHADEAQKAIFEAEATYIDHILHRYLEISRNEPPYDVFICYKETAADGGRTMDSVRAGEIYRELTNEGFKVFFAPVTLENKLGEDYEPYIFAAIHSAKVMVVIGTQAEYMNAVWVKNEWSRFLTLAKSDSKKNLIPVYSGMDPYDMPEAFRFKQSLNMDKLGFILDLVHGIEKLVGKTKAVKEVPVAAPAAAPTSASVDSLLQRVAIFLEDQEWDNANIYCEKVLDIIPTNSQAHFYKLLVEAKVSNESGLLGSTIALDKTRAYKNAVRYADEEMTAKLLSYNTRVKERLEREEAERLEAQRIRREQEQREAERRKELARIAEEYRQKKRALLNARDAASDLVSRQVSDKAEKEDDLQISTERLANLKSYKRKVFIFSLAAIFNTVLWISLADSNSDAVGFFLLLQFVISILLAHARGNSKVKAFFFTLFTAFIGPFFSGLKGLGEVLKSSEKALRQEQTTLAAEIQQLETDINTSRQSLSELNSKLTQLESESEGLQS